MDRVSDRTADVIVVDINKDLRTTERQGKHAEAKRWFEKQLALYPDLKVHEVRTRIMADRVAAARAASDDPDALARRHGVQRDPS